MEGSRASTLWDVVIDVSEPPASRARGDPSRQLKAKTLETIREPIDMATPNTTCVSHLSA